MTRINERIRVPEVRVVVATTKQQVGILPTHKALSLAKQHGLDLVEVAPQARPPVCYIVNYGKYKYEQSKQKKNNRPKTKIKEVKFRVRIDPHDYQIKLTRAEDFLAHGDKLRLQLQFRGRENAHKELGFELMEKVKEDLNTMSHVDMEPKLTGRNVTMMLSPLPPAKQKRKFRRPEDEHEVDIDAHVAAEAAENDRDDDDDDDDFENEHENEHEHDDVEEDNSEEAEEELEKQTADKE